jgi:hypothetical protein
MKKGLLGFILLLIIGVSIFAYNRYKAKRLDNLIGMNKIQVEEFLNYPKENVELKIIDTNNVGEEIQNIIDNGLILKNNNVLKYTLLGQIRKIELWLVDDGDGYKVIEATSSNL